MKDIKIRYKILYFILGVIVTMSTVGYAAYKYQAIEVGYTPSNSNFDVDNVSDAIKELYEKYENGRTSTSTDILGNMESSSNFLPTGYFKSTAEDNNVIFGGYCWKIIRKNDDDDIRLLYNGLPQDGECIKTGEDTQIDTSKYSDDSTITSYNNSVVKDVVDNWYNTNLATSYSEKISNIDLITREEASTVGGGYLVSGQSYWTQTSAGGSATITSSCSISTSSGGGCNATPTGNISSSTIYVIDTDGSVVTNNNGTYSGNITGTCDYCTMWRSVNSYDGSCGGLNGGYCSVGSYTYCGCCNTSEYENYCATSEVGSSLAVRPVITLKSTVTLQGGNGTTKNPYYLN